MKEYEGIFKHLLKIKTIGYFKFELKFFENTFAISFMSHQTLLRLIAC